MPAPTSSFSVRRVNKSTFLIIEDDKYGERPFIYAKLHPRAPILILNDTGCDAPRPEHKNADIVRLRQFLETYPVPEYCDKPLNAKAARSYVIILSHCHYDHIGGIEQFVSDERTEVIASAAGRDFIESDLPAHSLCKHAKIETPAYKVTHWAQSNERLTWPLLNTLAGDQAWQSSDRSKLVDLGLLMLQTPGHTPDSLSWFDEEESTLYLGDSIYRLGAEHEPIIFPPQGDYVEWTFSTAKVAVFAENYERGELREDADWLEVRPSLKVCASHETCNVPAEEFFDQVRVLLSKTLSPERKPVLSLRRFNELYDYYLTDVDTEGEDGMALLVPRRLIDAANAWFSNVSPFSRLLMPPQLR